MIDRNARKNLAWLLRHLATGRITNEQFMAAAPRTQDAGVNEVLRQAWFLFSDLREHRLAGEWALDATNKTAVARSILFLQSDVTYRWPAPLDGATRALLSVLTLGTAVRYIDRLWRRSGDYEVWPFFSQDEYRAALLCPRYLSGREN